jgi:putative spermidine/putrescine transport system substrate-binding protein
MKQRGLTRRGLLYTASLGAASIALAERGLLLRPAWSEERFTIASTGGSWGEGIREAFVEAPGFATKYDIEVSYSQQLESVATSKIIAQRGNPPFTVSGHGEAEAVLLADSGALDAYDLDIVTNYKNLYPSAKLPARAGMDAYWGSFMMLVFTMAYNTKEAGEPASYEELLSDKYKGRVGIPAYGWYGMYWLHALNKTLGGDENNISPGIEFAARVMKDNGGIVIENVDHGMKAFTREEVVVMPFWNGRTFALQEEGVPVALSYVPGTIQIGNGTLILKGSQFSELAQHYVNNTLNGEYQVVMSKKFRYPPSDSTYRLPPDMEHYQMPSAAFDNVVALDWQTINDKRAEFLERWNKEVLG